MRYAWLTTQRPKRVRHLALLSSSLADLGRETSLDGSDGTAGAARVAGDEVESVFSLVELGIRGAASLAGDIFD